VSEDEALDYLKNRNLDSKQASELYELVGGRVVQLDAAANDIQKNTSSEGMAQYTSKIKGVSFLPCYRSEKGHVFRCH
jgi:hypothetical protein